MLGKKVSHLSGFGFFRKSCIVCSGLFILCASSAVSVAQDDTETAPEWINPDTAPAEIQTGSSFSDQYGAYARETETYTIVYRRFLDSPLITGAADGEAVITSEIEHPELGTITLEQDLYSDGIYISDRPQLRFNAAGEDRIPEGLRQYFLLGYQKVYDVSEVEAEAYLADNVELPLSWQTEFTRYAQDVYLSASAAEVRYIQPQAGVSFVLIDKAFTLNPQRSTQRYPALATTFVYAGNAPGYTYGLDAEPTGRLVIYMYADYSDSFSDGASPEIEYGANVSGRLVTGTFDAYKFTIDIQNSDQSLSMRSTYHTNWNGIRSGSEQELIRIAYGFDSFEDYDAVSGQFAEMSYDELIAYLQPSVLIDVMLP